MAPSDLDPYVGPAQALLTFPKDDTVTVPPPAIPPTDGAGTTPACTITALRTDDVTVLSVAGTVDAVTAPQLGAALHPGEHDSARAIVVDLTEVDFLASTGMGLLFQAHADLAPATRLVIVADGPVTSRPLKLVGIADIVDLFTTLDEARAALATS